MIELHALMAQLAGSDNCLVTLATFSASSRVAQWYYRAFISLASID